MFGFFVHQIQTPPAEIEVVRHISFRNSDNSLELRRFKGTTALFYQSKMSCDVDGSPNAYNPVDDNLALDVIESAGGKRQNDLPNGALTVQPADNVVVYVNGAPYIQPDGEFKGFYVAETSLENPSLPATDIHRYLDARNVPFVVLPGGKVPEAELGDLVAVYDPVSKKLAYAVYGDIGPGSESGEVSMATIKELGLPVTDGKSSPGEGRNDLLYIVFPKSSWRMKGTWPLTEDFIVRNGNREFRHWGGMRRLSRIPLVGPTAGTK